MLVFTNGHDKQSLPESNGSDSRAKGCEQIVRRWRAVGAKLKAESGKRKAGMLARSFELHNQGEDDGT